MFSHERKARAERIDPSGPLGLDPHLFVTIVPWARRSPRNRDRFCLLFRSQVRGQPSARFTDQDSAMPFFVRPLIGFTASASIVASLMLLFGHIR